MLVFRLLRFALALGALAFLIAGPAAAQEMRTFAHDLGTTEIPVRPQRIVSLHDLTVTIPLIELGVTPVGSHGRVDANGNPYIRSALSLVGVDFSNSDIVWVGHQPADLETIAALAPDLIIMASQPGMDYAQLSAIAPTIVIEAANHPGLEQHRMIADAVGAQGAFAALETRFRGQIAEIRRLIPNAAEISVSVIIAGDGVVFAYRDYGGLSYVLREAGFASPEIVQGISEVRVEVSAEQLRAIDGDFIFDSYRNDQGQTPQTEKDLMQAVLPGWCDFLHACRNRQYILMPRDEMAAMSFRAFDLIAMTVLSQIAGRDFVPVDP